MRIHQITMTPFSFQTITDFESGSMLNEHGYAKISGYVTEQQRNEALGLMADDVWGTVCFQDEDGKSGILFCGLAVNMQIETENDCYLMTLELKTGTYLMDLKEHIRVFQSGSTTYGEIQNSFLPGYAMGECLMVNSDTNTDQMLVQYRETDWEFAKRLASRKNTVIVPNEKSEGVKYAFGLAEKNAEKLVSYDKLEMHKKIGEYQIKKQNGISGIEESDEIGYTVDSREIFFLGDCVVFGEKNYLVTEVHRTWVKKEVWNRYVLKTLKGTQMVEHHNKKIIGASLQGVVTDVEKDLVKITIHKDENGNQGGQKWFAYSTVFSSPDGTGWYCMPEKDDSIQLHFPNEVEDSAYVSSSVNMQPSDPEARSNPDHKSIKNKQGKEILFTPDKLIITNNKGMTITIDDEAGIIMESDKDILMKAEESIGLISEKQDLQMIAAEKVSLKQNATSLELADDIVMHGGKVNIQ